MFQERLHFGVVFSLFRRKGNNMHLNEEVKDKMLAWYKEFLTAPVNEMSIPITELFISILPNEAKPLPKDLEDIFLVQVISKRAEYMELPLTPGIKSFLTVLSKTPGTAVMYLSILKLKQVQEDITGNISMRTLAEIFPMGFPSEKTLQRLWEGQKMSDHTNMLDMAFVK